SRISANGPFLLLRIRIEFHRSRLTLVTLMTYCPHSQQVLSAPPHREGPRISRKKVVASSKFILFSLFQTQRPIHPHDSSSASSSQIPQRCGIQASCRCSSDRRDDNHDV